jgi:N-methylhydantoinase B
MLNNPFRGGTHLPDITIVAPVFFDGTQPVYYVANRAHHADVGGMTPGSMPLATSIFQEGIIISPLKIVERGAVDRKIMDFLKTNVRTPGEREGDFAAQIMANFTGIQRTLELIKKYGLDTVNFYAKNLKDYAERVMRATIATIPDGHYQFTDVLDDDGLGTEQIAIRLQVRVAGSQVSLDFSESDPQVAGSVNAVRAITVSTVLYVFRSLIREDIPTNAGCLRPLEIITTPGTIVDAQFPAAVAGGNVETSQRIVDVLLGALAAALPGLVPAASQGTMNNLTIGGVNPHTGKPFAYYETLAGGAGATAGHQGESAVHSHMTNTLNTPIEALEFAYPVQVTEYSIRKGSGGKGRFDGGDGLVREIRLLSDAEVTVLSERRTQAPYGLAGGGPGQAGKNLLVRKGQTQVMPGKFSVRLQAGDLVHIETPGGGGYGRPGSSEE